MNIFPMIQPTVAAKLEGLPLYRETKWDYETDRPVWENGAPVMAEGVEAVAVWAWNALHTVRYRHPIFTWNYGNEAESLIGQRFTYELKQAEAIRYVRECLEQNPYITGVSGVSVDFTDGNLTIACRLETIYGEIKLEG